MPTVDDLLERIKILEAQQVRLLQLEGQYRVVKTLLYFAITSGVAILLLNSWQSTEAQPNPVAVENGTFKTITVNSLVVRDPNTGKISHVLGSAAKSSGDGDKEAGPFMEIYGTDGKRRLSVHQRIGGVRFQLSAAKSFPIGRAQVDLFVGEHGGTCCVEGIDQKGLTVGATASMSAIGRYSKFVAVDSQGGGIGLHAESKDRAGDAWIHCYQQDTQKTLHWPRAPRHWK